MKPPTCAECPLYRLGEGWVPPSGPTPAPILLVGEAPGEWEATRGQPFVGQSGKLLDRLLHRAGADRAQFRVANILSCRPPHNYLAGAPYEAEAIRCCRRYLDAEILSCQPKVIVTLGLIATRQFSAWTTLADIRGFPIPHHPTGAWIVPTFHPAHLLPGRSKTPGDNPTRLTGLAILDLKRALAIAESGFTPAKPSEYYTLDPTPDEAIRWATRLEAAALAGRVRYLAWDIETPGKLRTAEEFALLDQDGPLATEILRIGFCAAPGEALSIPWQPEYLPTIHKLLSLPIPQATWNGYAFDLPIVRAHHVPLGGPLHDGMWAWHLLQSDLPRGLQTAASIYCPELGPWKHLDEAEPARYNAQDADVTLRVMLGLEADLHTRGAWGLYQRHVVDLWPILAEAGQAHGVRINVDALNHMARDLSAQRLALLRRIQSVVPRHLHTRKLWRQRVPPHAQGSTVPVPVRETIKACAVCGKAPINTRHAGSKICPTGYPVTRTVEGTRQLWQPDWTTIPDDQLESVVDVAGFNPASQKQLIAYAKAHGHAVGENWRTGNEQLDAHARSRLIKKHGAEHPIYALVSEYADLQKALTTYVQGYQPDHTGRIYTTYTFTPSTGRLSSRNVNLQNVAHGKYAGALRRAILPPPGCLFVEADSSAIEAVMTGFFIDDPTYIQLAKAGIHDYITCLELGRAFNVDALAMYKGDPVYKRARERNKRVIHGTNYGMTPKMMAMQYPDVFTTERQALLAQARYFEACPALPKWQHGVRLQAHRQTYLQNPWGYRHYFYGVFERNAKGEVVPGPDAKRCVAFLPQSSAAAFMRDSLLLLGASPWRAHTPANVSIHDSICLAVPEAQVPDAVDWLVETLTRPITPLGGLRVGCSVKVGPTWGEMTTIREEPAHDDVPILRE